MHAATINVKGIMEGLQTMQKTAIKCYKIHLTLLAR
jgi:hypothetical protein